MLLLLHDKPVLGIKEPANRINSFDYALSQIHMVPLLELKEQEVENLRNYFKVLENRLKKVEL